MEEAHVGRMKTKIDGREKTTNENSKQNSKASPSSRRGMERAREMTIEFDRDELISADCELLEGQQEAKLKKSEIQGAICHIVLRLIKRRNQSSPACLPLLILLLFAALSSCVPSAAAEEEFEQQSINSSSTTVSPSFTVKDHDANASDAATEPTTSKSSFDRLVQPTDERRGEPIEATPSKFNSGGPKDQQEPESEENFGTTNEPAKETNELDYILTNGINPTTTATSSLEADSSASSADSDSDFGPLTTVSSPADRQTDSFRDLFDLFPATSSESPLLEPEVAKSRPSSIESDSFSSSSGPEEEDLIENSLIRSRKSSESTGNGTTKSLESGKISSFQIQNDTMPATRGSISNKGNQNSNIFTNLLDYDDFDLDYQLKLNNGNVNGSSSGGNGLDLMNNLNKRDQEQNKQQAPGWTALLKQSHVFTPTSIASSSAPSTSSAPTNGTSGSNFLYPPIIPSLLTVKSTQLTSEELSKIKPQLLGQFYQERDEYSLPSANSSAPYQQTLDHSAYLANGDLLATASFTSSPTMVASIERVQNHTKASNREQQSGNFEAKINLLNGSPVTSKPASATNNLVSTKFSTQNSRLMEELPNSFVTTIVVDNSTPTEAPQTSSKSPSGATFLPTTSASETTTTSAAPTTTTTTTAVMSTPAPTMAPSNFVDSKPVANLSSSNQWHNYPHPNLHRNPLLLHHILNKPNFYSQHIQSTIAPSNQQAIRDTTTMLTPTSFASTTPSTSPATTSAAIFPSAPTTTTQSPQIHMIIEKPTLADLNFHSQSMNKTQLLMQLNELRALNAAKLEQRVRASNQLASFPLVPANALQLEHLNNQAKATTSLPQQNQDAQVVSVGLPFESDSNAMSTSRNPLMAPVFLHQAAAPLNQIKPQFQANRSQAQNFSQFVSQTTKVNGKSSPMMTSQSNQNPTLLTTSASNQIDSTPASLMSEEDMSTYVAELASFDSNPAQSVRTTSNDQSISGGKELSNMMLSKLLNEKNMNSLRLPATAASGQVASMNPNEPDKLEAGGEQARNVLPQILQHLLASSSSATPSNNSSSIDGILASVYQKMIQDHLEQQRQVSANKQQNLFDILDILKQVKLISLSDEVQARIYQDHLGPMEKQQRLQAGDQQVAWDSSAKQATEASSKHLQPQPNNWRAAGDFIKLSSTSNPAIKTFVRPLNSAASFYSSIDNHQSQQKKDRELMEQQRRQQLAFIEALRASLMQMHRAQLQNQTNSPAARENSILMNPSDFDEQIAPDQHQNKSTSAEWPEKQQIQESFLHESARVNPFGHTTKSVHIYRPPSSLLGRRPATILRPIMAGPHSSFAVRPVYPIGALAPRPLLSALRRPQYNLAPAPTSSYPVTSNLMAAHSMANQQILQQQAQTIPFAPVNPTKILSDRFPMASVPAYLIKLPTLTGGTITASGSLIAPPILSNSHRILFGSRNNQPLSSAYDSGNYLGPMVHGRAPGSPTPTSPLKLIAHAAALAVGGAPGLPPGSRSSGLKLLPAASFAHPMHQIPPFNYHTSSTTHFLSPPSYQPMGSWRPLSEHYQHPHHQQFNYAPEPVGQLRPYATLNQPQFVASNEVGHSAEVSANQVPSFASSTDSTSKVQAQSPASTNTQSLPSNHNNHLMASPNDHMATNNNNQQVSPDGNKDLSGTSQQTTLSRLQQATASLVELTSLASLVEEMVSGGDVESSPAMALANAINSLSMAQQNALNAQSTTTSTINQTFENHQQPASYSQFQPNNNNRQHSIFFLKNLLDPMIWRNKSALLSSKGRDLYSFERLMANALTNNHNFIRPPVRLKVKYIQVPVAVYESTGSDNSAGNQAVQNSQQTSTIQSVQGMKNFDSLSNPSFILNPSLQTTSTTSSPLTATQSPPTSSTTTTAATASNYPTPQNQQRGPSSADTISSISSTDYQFDELGSDSAPRLSFAQLRDHSNLARPVLISHNHQPALNRFQPAGFQQNQPRFSLGDQRNYLPILRPLRPIPVLNPIKSDNFQGGQQQLNSQATEMESLDSALYYSLQNNNQPANSMGGKNFLLANDELSTSESSPQVKHKSRSKGKRKGRKQKGKHENEDENELPSLDDDDEENDDDDLLSKDDLPILESLISTLVQHVAPPAPVASHHGSSTTNTLAAMAAAPTGELPTWLKAPKSFLRGELMQTGQSGFPNPLLYGQSMVRPQFAAAPSSSFANNLNPFGKYSHKFSFGEIVGAMGARKLISTVLNKRKKYSKITNKRAVAASGSNASSGQPQLKSGPRSTTTTTTSTTTPIYDSLGSPTSTVGQQMGDGMMIDQNLAYRPASTKMKPIQLQATSTKSFAKIMKPVVTRNKISFPILNSASNVSKPGAENNNQFILGGSDQPSSSKPLGSIRLSIAGNDSAPADVEKLKDFETGAAPNQDANITTAGVSSYLTDEIQFKFSQLGTAGTGRRTSDHTGEVQDKTSNVKQEAKNAMPLYHIVADHYSKLHSGPSSLRKLIADQQESKLATASTISTPISANQALAKGTNRPSIKLSTDTTTTTTEASAKEKPKLL